jgi:rhomboid protease GluP
VTTHDVSPAVVKALHEDAIRLKRGELVFVIPAALVSIAMAILAFVSPRQFWIVGGSAVGLIFYTVHWTVDWVRLRRTEPSELFKQERRADVEQAEALADFRARTAAVKPIATLVLAGAICLVTTIEFAAGIDAAVTKAGLVKDAARHGEWWRLLTASYLHGNLMHLLGNIGALAVLGEMIEIYDRRLRVALAYLAGVLGGSVLSLLLTRASSIGASAGVLGVAGYLLVLTYRRRATGSRWLRERLFRVVGSTAILGLIGFFFIDNAAHAGGLLAGAIAGLVAVSGESHENPARTRAIDAVCWAAIAVLAGGAALTLWKLLATP